MYLFIFLLLIIFILHYNERLCDTTKFKLEGNQFNTQLGYSYLDSCYSKFYNNYEDMNIFQ
jgi:hypothetical protein